MLDQKVLKELQEYIEQHLIFESSSMKYSECIEQELILDSIHIEIGAFVEDNRKPSLQEMLFRFIDQKKLKYSYVYKKAGIDRKLFSKIRSLSEYRPRKNTIIALGLALELSEENFEQLLDSGGYSLSDSETADLVIKFCLEKKIYDVIQVNEYLDYFSQKTLV
ncbi:hypothetical protein ABE41_001630 [Fictibacillus arsenicus]|uniref:Uncharacterized protein n=1 Tax=Fictibacillus arsenicus TaxID=255247 RepID=A0A1B1YZT7_9BACL|nr:hypothetical protein [Fictibacillus arsenicus]ANX10713.1 hypothetical protein ABE41_001630 [Fictibacillus arsenicus]